MRGRFKRQPHIKLCAIGTRAEVDFSVMPFDDDPVDRFLLFAESKEASKSIRKANLFAND